eukprot:4078788-Pyramimonas_sp.AAC.1
MDGHLLACQSATALMEHLPQAAWNGGATLASARCCKDPSSSRPKSVVACGSSRHRARAGGALRAPC